MDKVSDTRRGLFEQAVIKRMKEGGFLEVEIRVECLSIGTDGAYHDPSVDTYWHYFNAALDAVEIELPRSWNSEESVFRDSCVDAIESTNLGIKVK